MQSPKCQCQYQMRLPTAESIPIDPNPNPNPNTDPNPNPNSNPGPRVKSQCQGQHPCSVVQTFLFPVPTFIHLISAMVPTVLLATGTLTALSNQHRRATNARRSESPLLVHPTGTPTQTPGRHCPGPAPATTTLPWNSHSTRHTEASDASPRQSVTPLSTHLGGDGRLWLWHWH